MLDRETALREMIGEYEDERSLVASRLETHRLRRARLVLAREALLENGETAEADRLKAQIREEERHIQSNSELLARLDGLITLYRTNLAKLRQGAEPDK